MDIQEQVQKINLADSIPEEELKRIGTNVIKNYEIDEQSRYDWFEDQKDYLRLAVQIKETKSFPWQKASNVKYPLLTIASIQFQARAYQALLPDTHVVKGRVIGNDPDNTKTSKASRISMHMSYQLLEEIENWEDDMDKLCLLLPICGTVFKKIYHDGDHPQIELLLPQDVVCNYNAKIITKARISQILEYDSNEVVEFINAGTFRDYDYTSYSGDEEYNKEVFNEQGHTKPYEDDDKPICFIEQHTWLDLDGDGYKEPYVVTVHKYSNYVARITARFRPDGVITDQNGNIIKINPVHYYEVYNFIPNPVSGIYGIGFGSLLGPINEAANTLINQLVDSGTLNNLPAGFLGRGIRLQGGNYKMQPGEFKFVQNTGDDLRKGIFQFDFKPPSAVLFQLLGMMITAGQNIASVTETMLGEQPGQNTPFSTTQEVLNQGLKVYASIMKRIHRTLKREFKKLYQLNKYYIDTPTYFTILDNQNNEARGQVLQDDYKGDDTDVIPASDPNVVSDIQKLRQSQVVLGLAGQGMVNPQEASRRVLEAERIPDLQKLLEMPEPQPNFDQQIALEELKLKQEELQMKAKIGEFKASSQAARDEAAAALNYAKAQAESQKGQLEAFIAQHEMAMKKMEMQLQAFKAETDLLKTTQELAIKDRESRTKRFNPNTGSFE